MASPIARTDEDPGPTAYLKTLLGETALWTGESFGGTYDLERALQLNSAISYTQINKPSSISLIASQDNAFIASLSIDEGGSDIRVIVYRTETGLLEEAWTSVAIIGPEAHGDDRREKISLRGWISCDGRRVLVEYRPDYSDSRRIVTANQGRTWAPFRIAGARYDSGGISRPTIITFFTLETEVVLGAVDRGELSMSILQQLGLVFAHGPLRLEMDTSCRM